MQSDSKKKCLILKNVWTMSFWDLERIISNDSMNLELRGEDNIKGEVVRLIFHLKTTVLSDSLNNWIDSDTKKDKPMQKERLWR